MTQIESRSTMNIVEVIDFLRRNNRPQTALDLMQTVLEYFIKNDFEPILCDHEGNMSAKYIHWMINDHKLSAKLQSEVTTTVLIEENS